MAETDTIVDSDNPSPSEESAGLQVVIIGYGLAGAVFHAPLIATTPGLHLAGIVTQSDERIAQARATYPGIKVYPSTGELWNSDLPDVVVVATPNNTHATIALQAINHGVAVVVDKPIAVTAAEAEEVVAAAEAANVLLTVYQNRRWDGDFQTVRQLISAGTLGRICRFESRFERWRPHLKGGWRESARPTDGGGLLFDLGPHIIDQATQLFGPARQVYAEVDTRRTGATSDDDVFVALTHATGVRSHLFASAVSADIGPRFRVLGTAGAYVSFGLDPQEAQLRAGAMPGPGWGTVPEANWGTLTTTESARVATAAGNYPAFYSQLRDAIINGGRPPVDPNDAVTTLRIIAAAAQSSATSRVVAL